MSKSFLSVEAYYPGLVSRVLLSHCKFLDIWRSPELESHPPPGYVYSSMDQPPSIMTVGAVCLKSSAAADYFYERLIFDNDMKELNNLSAISNWLLALVKNL